MADTTLGWCSAVGTLPRRYERVKMRRKLQCPICGNVAWYDPSTGFRRHKRGVKRGRPLWMRDPTRGFYC